MGGSASLVQIPNGIINETDVPNRLLGINTTTSLIKKEESVLTASKLKDFDNWNNRTGGNKRVESTLPASTPNTEQVVPSHPKPELPPNVKIFLESIAISTDDRGIEDESILAGRQEVRTKKLVGHIFECLGALQHLVKASQDLQSMEDVIAEETQSIVETNKQAVGKLLHEMINIYTVCGDTVRVLLRSTPEAARVEDDYGRLPLHIAVDRDQPWMDAVEQLIVAYPGALERRDGGGRLPLHIAVDRQQPCVEVVKLLVLKCPAAATARRGVGRLALHYVIFSENPSYEILDHLLSACPESAQMVDVYGRLPLHYAVSKSKIAPNIIRRLLQAYPDGAKIRDRQSRLPLALALDHENVAVEIIQLLVDYNPDAVSEADAIHHQLPLQQAMMTNSHNILVCQLLARAYPEGIFYSASAVSSTAATAAAQGIPAQSTRSSVSAPRNATGNDDSAIARSLLYVWQHPDLTRYFLKYRPEYNRALWRELNWRARKLVFLLVRSHFPHCSSSRKQSLLQRLGLTSISTNSTTGTTRATVHTGGPSTGLGPDQKVNRRSRLNSFGSPTHGGVILGLLSGASGDRAESLDNNRLSPDKFAALSLVNSRRNSLQSQQQAGSSPPPPCGSEREVTDLTLNTSLLSQVAPRYQRRLSRKRVSINSGSGNNSTANAAVDEEVHDIFDPVLISEPASPRLSVTLQRSPQPTGLSPATKPNIFYRLHRTNFDVFRIVVSYI